MPLVWRPVISMRSLILLALDDFYRQMRLPPIPILSSSSRSCVVTAEKVLDLMKFNSAADIDRLSGDVRSLIGT